MQILAEEGQDELVSQFFLAVIIARIPLFLFQAVQAALLPRLSALATQGSSRNSGSGSAARQVVAGTGSIAVVAATLSSVRGPSGCCTATGIRSRAPHRRLAGRRQRAVHARSGDGAGGHRARRPHTDGVLLAGGVVTFMIVTAAGHDLYLRVELGLLAGSAVACVGMATFVMPARAQWRDRSTPATSSKRFTTSPSNPEKARYPRLVLHHLTLWVPDLERAEQSWQWLLGELGYDRDVSVERVVLLRHESGVAVVLEQSPDMVPGMLYSRMRPGLNHLAFHVESDECARRHHQARPGLRMVRRCRGRHVTPIAGGAQVTYLEDRDGFESRVGRPARTLAGLSCIWLHEECEVD